MSICQCGLSLEFGFLFCPQKEDIHKVRYRGLLHNSKYHIFRCIDDLELLGQCNRAMWIRIDYSSQSFTHVFGIVKFTGSTKINYFQLGLRIFANKDNIFWF